MATKHVFEPDYAIPPGDTLREALDEREISQVELALRTGLTEKTISQIINGIAPISYETAERFELAMGVPASFWNSREAMYRAGRLRAEENKRLESEKSWLREIPVQELIARGYLQRCDSASATVRAALRFFQVSSVDAWKAVWAQPQVLFRGGKSAQSAHPGFVAAWLRIGEIEASRIECASFEVSRFRNALKEIRGMLTAQVTEWLPRLTSVCAAAGVAVVWIREIPGAGVCGITKWLSKDKALILLSLKYKSQDQVWFSFFHEACHVLKHAKKRVFYEFGTADQDAMELEANEFAANILIPPTEATRLPLLKDKAAITAFAARIGVPRATVIGRLQRDGILPKSVGNDLKERFAWPDD
jgi:plasmid maintenance system antidote protein VapI/Zn-dependent peptidase ImmA (M78 family)